jgi:hypothetical protein
MHARPPSNQERSGRKFLAHNLARLLLEEAREGFQLRKIVGNATIKHHSGDEIKTIVVVNIK